MDSHLYVDQYLRRRKGVAFPASSVEQQQLSAAAHNAILAAAGLRRTADSSAALPPQQAPQPPPLAPAAGGGGDVNRALSEHADVVKDLAVHVQSFVDKTDALNLQTQTMEDKILNLTKMVKVAQEVGDEQTQALAETTEELRQQLEQSLGREATARADFDALQAAIPSMIDESVKRALAAARSDSHAESESVHKRMDKLEKQQAELRAETTSSLSSRLDSVRELQAKHRDEMMTMERELSRQMAERKSAMEAELRDISRGSKIDLTAFVTTDAVRRMIDERVDAVREHSQQDVRQTVLTAQATMREEHAKVVKALETDVSEINGRLNVCEDQAAAIEGSFHEFIAAFKEHTLNQSAKMEDTAASMKQLMELHDETRNLVATEIEGTKQWATRNMLRLKKHLDNTNIDITALKDAHRDLHLVVERLRAAQGDHQERLAELVAHRTKEADALAEMVDREIATVQNIARAYRQGPAHGGGTVGAARRTASVDRDRRRGGRSGSRGDDHTSDSDVTGLPTSSGAEGETDEALDRFANRTVARRERMRQLFQELTFRERDVQPLASRRGTSPQDEA